MYIYWRELSWSIDVHRIIDVFFWHQISFHYYLLNMHVLLTPVSILQTLDNRD